MSKKPHVHTYDEAVFFIGSDPRHFSDLGAEVEMSIGAEEEKHTFNQATVVVLPAGVPHCPDCHQEHHQTISVHGGLDDRTERRLKRQSERIIRFELVKWLPQGAISVRHLCGGNSLP